MERELLFEAKKLTKHFGPTVALDNVDFKVYRGEITGLIGENGSGKSTITSIAAGMQPATSGEMFFKGQPHKPSTMIEGAACGIGMIVQEQGTVSGISVAQNIFLGNEKKFTRFGIVNKKAMNAEAKKALDAIGFEGVDPSTPIDSLNMQDRKLVEIAKTVYQQPEMLVVDETTTALSQKGRDIAVIILFEALTGGALLSSGNVQALINSVIVTALAALGAVFVFGSGYFDMSLGGCICFSAAVGALVCVKTGSLVLGTIAIVAVAIAFGLVKGIFAATVNVPFFIFTIVLGSVLSSVVLVIIGNKSSIKLVDAGKEIFNPTTTQMTIINVICIVAFLIACIFIFNFTSMGIRVKNLGGNKISARQSGIDIRKTTIASFLISAVGVAIAAFLLVLRTRSISGTTAGSVGNDVMIALVLGGMPLSGGPRSKVSAGILGAATITVLNSGLTIMGLSTGQVQICRGIVFIVVVFISSFSYRTKLLPR